VYPKFSGLSHNEIDAYNNNTSWEETQRVMAAKLTRLTHKIAIQLHLVAESSTISSVLAPGGQSGNVWIHLRLSRSSDTVSFWDISKVTGVNLFDKNVNSVQSNSDIVYKLAKKLVWKYRWRWVVSFTPRPLYSQGKSPWYPLDRRLCGPQSRSGRGGEEENSQPLPGLEPPIIQPVALPYTTELSRIL
jgi:hypothetical protein